MSCNRVMAQVLAILGDAAAAAKNGPKQIEVVMTDAQISEVWGCGAFTKSICYDSLVLDDVSTPCSPACCSHLLAMPLCVATVLAHTADSDLHKLLR